MMLLRRWSQAAAGGCRGCGERGMFHVGVFKQHTCSSAGPAPCSPRCCCAPQTQHRLSTNQLLQEGGGLRVLYKGPTRSSALLPSVFLTTTESDEALSHRRDNKLHWAHGWLGWTGSLQRGKADTKRSVLKVGAQGSSQTFLVSTTAGSNFSAPVSRTRTVSISHHTLTWNRLFLRFPKSTQVTTK